MSCMSKSSRLTDAVIRVIKETAPVVAPLAGKITQKFYPRMFKANPEVLEFFNMQNQREGRQPEVLAEAVVAYASNIDNLGVLGDFVSLMVEKHCALGVQPEHYGIVHSNLMGAVGEVLGDAVTPEIGHAWSEAVLELASLLIAAEAARYKEVEDLPGGWRGKRPFVVSQVTPEATDIVSVEFKPADGGRVPTFAKPGQYITLASNPLKGGEYFAPRHYTISGINNEMLRATVRLHRASDSCPAGRMSSFVHSLQVGDEVLFHPPFGAHHLDDDKCPVVFASAGVGITPTAAMLPAAIAQGRSVSVAHVCKTPDHFALRREIEKQVADAKGTIIVAYSQCDTVPQGKAGRLTGDDVLQLAEHPTDTNYYICGPPAFMKDVATALYDANVPKERVKYEAFGPAISL